MNRFYKLQNFICLQAVKRWEFLYLEMIQPNEIRIGNIVNCIFGGLTETLIIKGIGEENVYFEGETTFTYDSVFPLTLTPEILAKAGLQKVEGFYHLGDFVLDDEYFLRGPDRKNKFGEPIAYLHELQNLYFALYKQELDVVL